MKKTTKRRMLSVILALAMLLSCAACGSGGQNETSSAASTAASTAASVADTTAGSGSAETEPTEATVPEPVMEEVDDSYMPGYYKPPHMMEGQYPIPEEGVKLTYWMPIRANAAKWISSYDENPAYQKIQEETGVDIEFIHPANGTEKETLNTMLMSGQMPDLIQISNEALYEGGVAALYQDGAIIDLTPYLEEFAPQYKAVLDHDEIAQKMIYKDGKVLGFYKITYTPDALPHCRVNVNKDWLDEFGMTEPKTIGEFEAYFQAILDNKPGVTPLYFRPDSTEQLNVLMGAFDIVDPWYMKDDKTVDHCFDSTGYKEFLECMNRWYEKGYLSHDFTSLSQSEAQTLFATQKLGAIVDSVDTIFSTVGDAFTVTNCPYMRKEADSVTGNKGVSRAVDRTNAYVTVITSACKNVEAAIRYLNYGYTFEGSLVFKYAIEGEHWYWDENGFPQFTEIMTNNPDGMTMSDVSYAIKIHFGSSYSYPDDIALPAVVSNPVGKEIRMKWINEEQEQSFLIVPPVELTTEETIHMGELQTQVNTYVDEMKLKFITGAAELDDASFDAFVAECNNRGLSEMVAIEQTALDRWLAD